MPYAFARASTSQTGKGCANSIRYPVGSTSMILPRRSCSPKRMEISAPRRSKMKTRGLPEERRALGQFHDKPIERKTAIEHHQHRDDAAGLRWQDRLPGRSTTKQPIREGTGRRLGHPPRKARDRMPATGFEPHGSAYWAWQILPSRDIRAAAAAGGCKQFATEFFMVDFEVGLALRAHLVFRQALRRMSAASRQAPGPARRDPSPAGRASG